MACINYSLEKKKINKIFSTKYLQSKAVMQFQKHHCECVETSVTSIIFTIIPFLSIIKVTA